MSILNFRLFKNFFGRSVQGAGGPAQLVSLTSLLAHWKLDEGSGTREDSHSTNQDLTDVNTVTQASGKIDESASFAAVSNEGLSNLGSTFTLGADKTFCGWIYLEDKLLVYTFFSKWNPGEGNEYQCRYNSITDRFEWMKGDGDVGTLETVKADTFGSPIIQTWYFICCKYNHTTKIFSISINNGAFNDGVDVGASTSSNGDFFLGRLDTATSLPLNGRIDEFSVFGRILSAGEITALFNSGDGLTYPFTA